MLFAQFQSSDPFDHVARMLGQLERMGFSLESMSVQPSNRGLSEIRVVFEPAGLLSPDTFADRIAQLRGVHAFQQGQIQI
ncbi:hypothetical protein [Mesorhizobium sp. CO1-1-8]|uniref:hypothetical protein n=1 Tax=Mesorhizobium sp. CO1-1-8 TaxID=2876631 RepID=UPI001CD13F7A|nr:hypothetical protein [Mesorhizobium sp. CO1-1-8]MBZ9772175.1 hypothetical protein [Mesorhizobium sp. CO1-1-8]